MIVDYTQIPGLRAVTSTAGLLALLAVAGVFLIASKLAYNVFLHPARKFPGPLLARCTRAYYSYYRSTGQLEYKTKELHDKYGDVVRIAPDELSFNGGPAWDEIYGLKTKKRPSERFAKDPHFYMGAIAPNGEKNLGASEDADHSRIRSVLAHAFSDRALYAQEARVARHADRLVARLRALRGRPTDAVRWLHHCTYDMVTELAFGRGAGTLECDAWSPQAHLIFEGIKEGIAFVEALRFVPYRRRVLRLFMWAFGGKRTRNFEQSVEKARARMDAVGGAAGGGDEKDGWDFMSYALRANRAEHKKITPSELTANVALLIDAGSETTASMLSGCLFYLTSHPAALRRLADEVRGAYAREADMETKGLARLPYLTAVIEEALRMFPPVAGATPRVTPPGGAAVAGRWVPGGLAVAVNQYATYRSAANFADPYGFHPERWLGGDPRFAGDRAAAFQPFSTGPRNCLGKNLAYAEMRLVLGRLVWNFDMRLAPESANWHATQKTFFIWDKPDLMIVFNERQACCEGEHGGVRGDRAG